MVLPSGEKSKIKRIVTFDGDIQEAFAPMSITLTLADEIDASRGDMIVRPGNLPRSKTDFDAMLVYDERRSDGARQNVSGRKHHAERCRERSKR